MAACSARRLEEQTQRCVGQVRVTPANALFIGVAALVALLPGVGYLLKVLAPPSGLELESLALMEALSAIAIIVIWINRDGVRRWSKGRVSRAIVCWTSG